MNATHRFAIFPYLVTSQPINVCGITLRSTKDTKDLSSEAREHLEVITSFFFLQDHLQIEDMIYAYLPTTSNEEDNSLVEQLNKVQVFFAYVYTSPGNSGSPFYGLEHCSMFVLSPGRVSQFTFQYKHKVKNLWPEELLAQFNQSQIADGYEGSIMYPRIRTVV